MSFEQHASEITRELSVALSKIDGRRIDQLVGLLERAETVFVAGAGRSGLAMRAFAMRLMHMGKGVSVVSETATSRATQHDLLLIGSGSGSTASLLAIATRAKNSVGASVALITTQSQSPIGQLADVVVQIPAPTPKAAQVDNCLTSAQPMGSLFEQTLFLSLDAVVLMLMQRSQMSASVMFERHANLE
jgi:6-phospho-3-hexuloisomerase